MFLAANISMLFTEFAFLDRFAQARQAGFTSIEIQFPYQIDCQTIREALEKSQLALELINLPAGDLQKGDMGLGADPSRRAEFREAVELALGYASTLGVRKVNLLAGNPGKATASQAMDTFVENLRYAADRFEPRGIRVTTEPVNSVDRPDFFLDSLGKAKQAIALADHQNLRLKFDLYHMAQTEVDLCDAIGQAGSLIGHVQFADFPGRHEPGTGRTDFGQAIAALGRAGYDGCVAAEYLPAGTTRESLGWMDAFAKALSG